MVSQEHSRTKLWAICFLHTNVSDIFPRPVQFVEENGDYVMASLAAAARLPSVHDLA